MMAGYSKLDLVNSALNEIGFADYVYDIDPAQLNRVLLQMDAMMMGWKSQGINVGYYQTYTPGLSDINSDSGLPSTAIEACYLGLAKRIAPSFGKTLSPETKTNFSEAWRAMLSNLALDVVYKRPANVLAGAGNKSYIENIFLPFTEGSVDELF
jgi:hypothetical protein